MHYINLHIKSDAKHADLIADQLSKLGALSVSMQDDAKQDIFELHPGDNFLWDRVLVTGLFSNETVTTNLIGAICAELNLPSLEYKIENIEDQDWVRLTQQHFKSQCYADKLWISPSWEDDTKKSGIIVKIDPGLAFGTGTHATTTLCLQWLATHPPKNKNVIDYGCGSGILSLAALALGANNVVAIDHDPQALIATKNNANLNAFAKTEKLHIFSPETSQAHAADIVIANILANPLIQLESTFTSLVKPHGNLILSGILTKEHQNVLDAYQHAFTLLKMQTKEEWCLLALQRK